MAINTIKSDLLDAIKIIRLLSIWKNLYRLRLFYDLFVIHLEKSIV